MLLEQSSQGWSNADEVTIRFLGSKGHQEGQKLEKKRRKKEKNECSSQEKMRMDKEEGLYKDEKTKQCYKK